MESHIRLLFNQDVLKEAGKKFGVKLEELYEVGGFENFIYGYKKGGDEFILRISHSSHRTFDQLLSELDFVHFLAENHANVSIPVQSVDHHLIEKVELKDSYFTVSSYIKALGERPSKDYFDDTFFYNYGKTIGQFHRLTKKYQPSNGVIKRFKWDEDPLFINARSYLPDSDEIIYTRFVELIEELNQFKIGTDHYGLIHTDIHMGNFFIKDKKLTVFDFDDCSYMWYASDIAIALFYFLEFSIRDEKKYQENAHYFMTHFMKGYLSENNLIQDDMKTVHSFLKLRELVLYIVFFRSVDLTVDSFASKFISRHRQRIINQDLFVDIDFIQYLK